MAEEELRNIIRRCQILDEEEFKGEDFNLFQVAGQKCLEEGYIAEVLEVFQNEKNQVIVKSMGWNLIGPLVGCLLKYKQDDVRRGFCLKILEKLMELCSPKELVLGFLEQIEQASGEQISQTVLLLLKPLQEVLLKLHRKKAYSVGLSLSTILSQLSVLPVPYTKQQLQEDKHDLCQCCSALIHFVKPFVDETVKLMEASSSTDYKDLKEELLGFCLKSLKYPLLMAEFDQLPEDSAEHPLRQFAADIIAILLDVRELFPKVFSKPGCKNESWDDEDLVELDKEQTADSLACLSYMVFVQDCFGIDCLPVVFNPSYILQCNMGHIQVLLKRTEEPVLSKGLDLLENCLLRLEDNSLLLEYLEFKGFITTPQDLVKVMILCPLQPLRKKSLKILQLYIDKFEEEGKYTLFRCLLKTSNHSGVEGYIIQNLKNQIDLSLQSGKGTKCFTGLQLVSLLDIVLSLPEDAETDLLQNSDRIMASLNLLRYLVIKDNENDNQTCVWTELPKIEQNFLKPLHTGLNMSRAHYEAEIKSKKENKRESHSSKKICSVTVAGEKMPNMTTEMELQVLHSALFTFDLIESVLARVEELIETKTKAATEGTAGVK
ncbi:glomulin [Hemicordylus capensis]|uniref:glomulin n=1 Tax=Hemicordylus capensis TaxID=884348 RepID=UPI002302DEF0|nr:glomulin [Hemicordylus capensis]XP_053099597.1 glomulin [Hemicordylus capensis]XP_053099598.1 glomulin [Hemicordylus capensis]XP_053099599.1 glomulin [Hemicordylus capensis]XP_053099600.1 glomulin [Hemicordylus capensis]